MFVCNVHIWYILKNVYYWSYYNAIDYNNDYDEPNRSPKPPNLISNSLGCPALADLEQLFKTQLISGGKAENRFRHYTTQDMSLVTTSLKRFLENIRSRKPTRTLYICHITRDDLILGFLGEYQRRKARSSRSSEPPFEAALLVCGSGTYELSKEIEDMITDDDDGPSIMIARGTTHEVMTKIHA